MNFKAMICIRPERNSNNYKSNSNKSNCKNCSLSNRGCRCSNRNNINFSAN